MTSCIDKAWWKCVTFTMTMWPSTNQYLPNSVTHQPTSQDQSGSKVQTLEGLCFEWIQPVAPSEMQHINQLRCQHCPHRKWLVNTFPIIVARSLSCSGLCGLGNGEPLKLFLYYYLIDDSFDLVPEVPGQKKAASSKTEMLRFALPALGIYLANPIMSNIDPWASLPGNPTLCSWCFVGFGWSHVFGVLWLTSPRPNQEYTVPCLSSFCWGRINLSILQNITQIHTVFLQTNVEIQPQKVET